MIEKERDVPGGFALKEAQSRTQVAIADLFGTSETGTKPRVRPVQTSNLYAARKNLPDGGGMRMDHLRFCAIGHSLIGEHQPGRQ